MDTNNIFQKIQDSYNEIEDKLWRFTDGNEIDSIIIDGIKRSGYNFDSTEELQDFIKRRCQRVTSATHTDWTVFCIDYTPFLYFEKGIWNVISGDITPKVYFLRYKFV